jgi:membrane protease YdiL (CAAX protease family)
MNGSRRIPRLLLAVALVYPTAAALLYFVALSSRPLAGPAYFVCKAIQFSFPLFVLPALRADKPVTRWSLRRSLAWGLGSGLALVTPMAPIYLLLVRDRAAGEALRESVAGKMTDFAIAGPLSYLAMTLFLSLLHSGLEEVYWRWFVYGGLRSYVVPTVAVVVSSLGFMSHHVVVLVTFLAPGPAAGMVVPAALSIALAGAVWAVLLERSGRLVAPWISHVLADLAIMALGWDLIWS